MEVYANIFILAEIVFLSVVVGFALIATITWRSMIKEWASKLSGNLKSLDGLLSRLDAFFSEVSDDNEKCELLRSEISHLQILLGELDAEHSTKKAKLSNLAGEEMRIVNDLTKMENRIFEGESELRQLEEHLAFIKKEREGLKMAMGEIPMEESEYLGTSVDSLGLHLSATKRLKMAGLYYVGDILDAGENFLRDLYGIGPSNVERIKELLHRHNIYFAMETIRIGNRWYYQPTSKYSD